MNRMISCYRIGGVGLGMLLVVTALNACTSTLAERMVQPPNGKTAATVVKASTDPKELRVPVGPPYAVLVAHVVEPEGGAVRGTILALHGLLSSHHQFQPAAEFLSKAGYRVVLVDLRGHGDSTGDYITYGVQDAKDLVQLTNYLQQNNLCGPTLGVIGTSYGAATSILYAAADPRVVSMVAIAPFASLRQEAPHFGKYIVPVPGRFYSDADYVDVVNTMGKVANFNPDECDPLKAVTKTQAKVRLFHGTFDVIIPMECSKQIAAAAPDRTQLTVVEARGHIDLCFDILGSLHSPAREWFDQSFPAVTPAETLARSSPPPHSSPPSHSQASEKSRSASPLP